VPPKQCPACGRFLKNAFVVGLGDAAAPCPGCGDELTAIMFAVVDATPDAASVVAADVSSGATTDTTVDRVSVRPPDLEPASVRDTTRDVLAGWDTTASAEEIASWRRDRRPFPTDTVVVVGSGALGAIAGGVIGRNHDPRRLGGGVAGGLVVGLAVAAVSRRIWRLR
jgi:hypothetical protein